MADNYLERKMEEHRAGRPTTTGRRPDTRRAGVPSPGLHLQYPKMWLVVLADDARGAEPFVAAFRAAGINVALSFNAGGKEANALSQKLGARLYPDRCETGRILADLAKAGHSPEWIIDLRSSTEAAEDTIRISERASTTPCEVLARELLFLLHPDHRELLQNQELFLISLPQ